MRHSLALLLFLSPAPALAHPHIFIDTRYEVAVYDIDSLDKRFTVRPIAEWAGLSDEGGKRGGQPE